MKTRDDPNDCQIRDFRLTLIFATYDDTIFLPLSRSSRVTYILKISDFYSVV